MVSPSLKEEDSIVPNSRDQFSNLTAYNSPVRGSYSAMKQKQQTYNMCKKSARGVQKPPISGLRGYSASKNSSKNLYM